MFGTTLVEIRERIEDLASPDGAFYVVCGRTGTRPVPAADARFSSRETAREAARATEQYRAALRRYDPQLPCYDVIVCQDADVHTGCPTQASAAGDDWSLSTPASEGSEPTRPALIDCCHRVAAAVFEALSEAGHDAVETAVMDAYLDLAESVTDPDDLCLCLLEGMAAELDAGLDPVEQTAVLSGAAARLAPVRSTARPLAASLRFLRRRGLVEGFSRSPWSVDDDAGTRSVDVRVAGYALSPQRGRLPVLPVAVDLYRRRPDWPLSTLRIAAADPGWRITLVFAREPDPTGLASAPIEPTR